MPYALLIIAGEREGETYPVPEDRALTVGRESTNDIRLLDRKLSRIHCQVEVIGGRCQVSDLNSTNGTIVNGRRIEASVAIQPDDEVEIGMTRMRLIEVSPAEAAVPKAPKAAKAARPAPDRAPAEGAERCAECGKAIAATDVGGGAVRTVGDRHYCAACSATFSQTGMVAPLQPEPLSASLLDRLKPGKEVAGIRVLNMLAEGRLGPLFKAEQVSMGRLVALKVINVQSADWVRKYLNAVYNSGQLVHANIVLVFDTGEEAGISYVVREYVDGQSAQEQLANREPTPLGDAYSIITQVAYAVEHAVERHIFHGVLSPRKVLISTRGNVKVTAFGLPQTPPPGQDAWSYTWHALPYMAPERLRGSEALDFAGDVYSVVAIFYHLLTGHAPFAGSTRERIAHRIANRPPKPLADFVPGLPPAAQKIVDRGLSKDPRARYQLPRELLFDLEEGLRREM